MQGQFTVQLAGGFVSSMATVAIGQVGQIPENAKSITFFGEPLSHFQITFGGEPIPTVQIGSGTNYIIMGGDISAYAGQSGQLLFTALPNEGGLLDNIQFSTMAVPEPSAWALSCLGVVLFGFGCRRKFRRFPTEN